MGGLGLALVGTTLVSRYIFGGSGVDAVACGADPCPETVRYTVQRLPSPTATGTPTATPRPITPTTGPPVPLADAATPTPVATVVSLVETLVITGVGEITATVDTRVVSGSPQAVNVIVSDTVVAADEPYTSTHQVTPPPSAKPTATPEPSPVGNCPTASNAQFDLIPIEGPVVRDHPDAVHGDLNLALRGYIPVHDSLERVTYNGSTDGDAPRLHGLFEPNRQAQITSVYRVNDWEWDPAKCGGHPRGCPAPPLDKNFWAVTLVGLATTPGEPIYIPERGAQIYPGGFVAMVLFAEEQRLTLGYTRRDTVSTGYVVHLENVCVDSNLVALYQAQLDAAGWNDTGHLPALRNNQALGTALNTEIRVAVRDAGTFMDPRSQKDWWSQ